MSDSIPDLIDRLICHVEQYRHEHELEHEYIDANEMRLAQDAWGRKQAAETEWVRIAGLLAPQLTAAGEDVRWLYEMVAAVDERREYASERRALDLWTPGHEAQLRAIRDRGEVAPEPTPAAGDGLLADALQILKVLKDARCALTQDEIGDKCRPRLSRDTVGRHVKALRTLGYTRALRGGGEEITPAGYRRA